MHAGTVRHARRCLKATFERHAHQGAMRLTIQISYACQFTLKAWMSAGGGGAMQ